MKPKTKHLKYISINNRNNPESYRKIGEGASVLGIGRATLIDMLVLSKADEFIAQLKVACQAKSEGAGA